MVGHHLPTPTQQQPDAPAWDNITLYSALTSAGVATTPPSSSEWFFDTSASSHMSNSSGIDSSATPYTSFVIVGNGALLPVTHKAAASIPIASSPLHLNNVLVTPSLVKNLV
jgi:hypothetical protein